MLALLRKLYQRIYSLDHWPISFLELHVWSRSGCRTLSARGSAFCAKLLIGEEQNVCVACKDKGECSQHDSELNYGKVFCSIVFSDQINNFFSPFYHFSVLN